jgi:hypothetical protein
VRVFHFCRENGCYCLADSVLADPRAAGRPPLPIQECRLSEIPRHVLCVECMRCARIVEIQKADAAASRHHHRDRRTGPTTDVVGPSALPALPLTPYIVAITSHVGLGTELKTDQEAA